jgi:Mn2+/Fe2+ NRAMP family transporter
LGILFSLGLSARIGWVDSYILIILYYALGTAVSGLILQLRELVFGGVFSILLVLGILLLQKDQVDFEAMLIAMAVSIVGTYLVPAYILRMKKTSDV